jgi:hypothetical protein
VQGGAHAQDRIRQIGLGRILSDIETDIWIHKDNVTISCHLCA